MNHLMQIAKYLDDSGVAIQGDSLFVHTLPSTTLNGVLLLNPAEGVKINQEIQGYYNTEFKAIVRAETYAAGNLLINKISSLLTTSEQMMGSIRVKQCYPYSESISYPITDNDTVEITLDFKIMFCEIL